MEAGNSASFAIAQFKLNICRSDRHCVAVIGGCNGQINSLPINSVDIAARKKQPIRNHNIQCLGSNHFAIDCHLNLRTAGFDCSKCIIFDGTYSRIGHAPLEVFWQFCRVAGAADTADRQGQTAANCQIIGIRSNQGMVKCVCGLRRGNYQQRRADRTFVSIRRTVHHCNFVRSLLLGIKGGRSAAIQVDSNNAACLQHDLGDFLRAAAGRERFLPSVQNHHNHFSVAGDTHTGAGRPGIVIICAGADSNLAVLHKEYAAAYGFLDLIFIFCVVTGAADYRGAILQNCKEVLVSNAAVLHAFHNQRATGRSGAHVIEIRIDSQYCIIVFNVVVRIIWIGVFSLSRCHLVGNSGHSPSRAVIIMVVCINADIFTANIDSSRVVHNLFAV